jgi:hypothetical protein
VAATSGKALDVVIWVACIAVVVAVVVVVL